MSDSFEEFEFKPLTEGLGFHKKAEKIKTDILSANLSRDLIRDSGRSTEKNFDKTLEKPKQSSIFGDFDAPATPIAPTPYKAMTTQATPTSLARENSKTASQSISELMASLPPSLDFLDDKPDLTRPTEAVRNSTLSFSTSSASVPTAPLAASNTEREASVDRPQIFQPLAREEYKSPIATGPTVGSVLPAPGTKAGSLSMSPAAATIPAPLNQNSAYRDRMNEGFAKAFPQGEKAAEKSRATAAEAAQGLAPVATNFAAGLIDAMVVAGISTILLVCIITITKINLIALLSNASTDGSTQMNLVLLTLAVLQVYMLISRVFAGATLGEWAFDLQLGTNEQQRTLLYPAQVLWRTIVNTITGLILIPLFSFAFNRDMSKYLTGTQLYRRV